VSEPVTVERLERALALCAYLVVRHGPYLTPIFERLERELGALRAQQNAMDRAKKLLVSLATSGAPMLLTFGENDAAQEEVR
jgi:hypothetical protein